MFWELRNTKGIALDKVLFFQPRNIDIVLTLFTLFILNIVMLKTYDFILDIWQIHWYFLLKKCEYQ